MLKETWASWPKASESVLVAQSRPTVCDPMDCSPPGSSVHGILQARILEWVAMPSSRGSSLLWEWTRISCLAGRFFTIWDTREAPDQRWFWQCQGDILFHSWRGCWYWRSVGRGQGGYWISYNSQNSTLKQRSIWSQMSTVLRLRNSGLDELSLGW